MPQDIVADLKRYGTTEECTMVLAWIPPSNLNTTDVTHYMVYINGTNVLNKTSEANHNLIVSAYRECSCATNYVGVSSVNRCSRESLIFNITVDQTPTALSGSECEDVTTTKPSDCADIIYHRDRYRGKTQ